jgi:hypothetical protein
MTAGNVCGVAGRLLFLPSLFQVLLEQFTGSQYGSD